MVVQAIALLDDLDKEINIYSMRVKEWYGWHFPELAKIIVDNQAYAKVVKEMGKGLICLLGPVSQSGITYRLPNERIYHFIRCHTS